LHIPWYFQTKTENKPNQNKPNKDDGYEKKNTTHATSRMEEYQLVSPVFNHKQSN